VAALDPGPRHGLPRSVAVYGAPRPGAEQLNGLLGRCDQLRAWARAHGFELEGVPEDLGLLDQAFDGAINQADGGLGGPLPVAAVASEAGLFLGTVIIATIPGVRWRAWPNGHPVVRLSPGRDLDVVAMAHDRVTKGVPLLATVYADAAAGPAR
jgi:uncharacterized protein DUF6278